MSKPRDPRVGNRTAAALATALTLIGHTFLGFEQPWAHVFVAVGTGYACALGFEWVDAYANGRPPAYAGGGWRKVADFLVSPHMTSITTSFLIYPNGHLAVLSFAVACALGSKVAFRIRGPNGRYVHFFNPSNFGIAVTLFLFPWVGVIPYAFLENTHGIADAIVPIVILLLGTRLNLLFTKRLPLIGTWVVAFLLQGFVRSLLFDTPMAVTVSTMTGMTFVLFSFYMITDPMTSPPTVRGQIGFGVALAAAYGALMVEHVIFTLFYAVFAVTGLRGLLLFVESLRAPAAAAQPAPVPAAAPAPTIAPMGS